MELELFIIIALVIVFLVSCCGLIQKIRDNYDEDRDRIISVTQIRVPSNHVYNSAYNPGDDVSSGIFPSTLAPPPYAEHFEPPPRYEDLIKENQFATIQIYPETANSPVAVFMNQNTTPHSAETSENTLPPQRSHNIQM